MFVIQNSLIMGILYAFLYSLRFPISFYLSNSGVFIGVILLRLLVCVIRRTGVSRLLYLLSRPTKEQDYLGSVDNKIILKRTYTAENSFDKFPS